MRKFTEDHLWVDYRHDVVTLGVTAYAAEELGEVSFVELPEQGVVLAAGDPVCVIESVKAATDVLAPVGGTVTAVNRELEETPALLNESPEKDAWICRMEEIEAAELDGLMGEAEYDEFVALDDGD